MESFLSLDLEMITSQVFSFTVISAGTFAAIPAQSRRSPLPDYDPYEDGVLPDLDTYEPTLHTALSMIVVGDLTEKGCYPDWALAEKTLSKWTRATLDDTRRIKRNVIFYWLKILMLVKAAGNSFKCVYI